MGIPLGFVSLFLMPQDLAASTVLCRLMGKKIAPVALADAYHSRKALTMGLFYFLFRVSDY